MSLAVPDTSPLVYSYGTSSILLPAKERHLLTAVRPTLEALAETTFYMPQALFNHTLLLAGEA